ncbi:hypothetical protein Aperf_G00000098420 [Anoplocephala perfoliata]
MQFSKFVPPRTFPAFSPKATYPVFNPTMFPVGKSISNRHVNNPVKEKKLKNNPMSKLYVFGPDQCRYLVTFRAMNPHFHFVETKERPATETQRTRATQAFSIPKYVPEKEIELHGKYFKKEFSKPRDEPKVKVQKHCAPCPENLESVILIEKDDMKFKVTLQGYLTFAAQLSNKEQVDNLGHCRASIVMKVAEEGDVARVNFQMEDLNFARMYIKSRLSRGCQTVDPCTYFKLNSALKSAGFIGVPRSTYIYIDPMIAIRCRNLAQFLKGEEPDWMEEVRRERLCRPCDAEKGAQYPGALMSSFIVERSGYMFKACTGPLKAKLLRGYSLYEEFVRIHSVSEKGKFY